MRFVLTGLALLFWVAAGFAVLMIRSDIQIILAVVLFGFGVVFVAIASALDDVRAIRKKVLQESPSAR